MLLAMASFKNRLCPPANKSWGVIVAIVTALIVALR